MPISYDEVVKTLETVKVNKAVGIDGICGEFFRAGVVNKEFTTRVWQLFNKVFEGGTSQQHGVRA